MCRGADVLAQDLPAQARLHALTVVQALQPGASQHCQVSMQLLTCRKASCMSKAHAA